MKKLYLLGVLLIAAVSAGIAGAASTGTPGVTPKSVLIEGTFPLSGPAAGYAPIAKSMKAYFSYINARRGPDGKRGVRGRQIIFKYSDDGYNPANTVQLTRQFVEQDHAFALVGGLGTEPQLAVRNYLNQQKVPQIFVSTGATTFGRDFSQYPWTIGWQPDYEAEGAIYGKYITKNIPDSKIGILFQNDDYGNDYVRGLKAGLGAVGLTHIVSSQGFEVTAPSVASQVAALKAAGVDTWMIFGTPTPTIRAYVTATKLGWKPAHIFTNSVSATDTFLTIAKNGGSDLTDGTITATYLRDPASPKLANDAGIKQFFKLMAKYNPSGDVKNELNIYGFAKADSFVRLLYAAGKNPTRASLMAATAKLNYTNQFVLPGVVYKTSANDRFPISQVTLTKYTNNTFVNFGGLINGRG